MQPKSVVWNVCPSKSSALTGMRMKKLRWEIFIGLALLLICVASILWVFEMVRAAPEEGTTECKDLKQWSMVLVLLSINTLFLGSVAGYLIGKYLHIA